MAGDFEGATHQSLVFDRVAVIGKGHRSQFGQLREGGECAASLTTHCYTGDWIVAHDGRLRSLQHLLQVVAAVWGRVGIGHGGYGTYPAGRRRCGAALNGLLVFVARFAEMGVNVDKTRGDNQAGGRQDGHVWRG